MCTSHLCGLLLSDVVRSPPPPPPSPRRLGACWCVSRALDTLARAPPTAHNTHTHTTFDQHSHAAELAALLSTVLEGAQVAEEAVRQGATQTLTRLLGVTGVLLLLLSSFGERFNLIIKERKTPHEHRTHTCAHKTIAVTAPQPSPQPQHNNKKRTRRRSSASQKFSPSAPGRWRAAAARSRRLSTSALAAPALPSPCASSKARSATA